MDTPTGPQWVIFETVTLDGSDFGRMGSDFELRATSVVIGDVGAATSRVVNMREAVQFAVDWIPRNRPRHREVSDADPSGRE
jgi:aminoglycoside N3'-acetyltransferase